METPVASQITPPKLLAPLGEAPVDPHRLVFTWEAQPEASAYWLQVSTDAAFADVIMETLIGSGSALTVYDLLPADGGTYYWRMRVQVGRDWSAYGPATAFRTVTKPPADATAPLAEAQPPPPDAPRLVAPLDGTPADASALTFAWTPVATADRYEVQVATTPRFDDLLLDLPVGATDALTIYGLLPPGTDGHWRVRGFGGDRPLPWSAPATFHAASDAEVEAHARQQAAAQRAEQRAAERTAAAPRTPAQSRRPCEVGVTTAAFAFSWFALLLVSFALMMVWLFVASPGT